MRIHLHSYAEVFTNVQMLRYSETFAFEGLSMFRIIGPLADEPSNWVFFVSSSCLFQHVTLGPSVFTVFASLTPWLSRYTYALPYLTHLGKGRGVEIRPHTAGHLLGGSIWEITKDSDSSIYAVDYNHSKERHLNRAVLETFVRWDNVDDDYDISMGASSKSLSFLTLRGWTPMASHWLAYPLIDPRFSSLTRILPSRPLRRRKSEMQSLWDTYSRHCDPTAMCSWCPMLLAGMYVYMCMYALYSPRLPLSCIQSSRVDAGLGFELDVGAFSLSTHSLACPAPSTL